MKKYRYVIDHGCTGCDGCRWECPADAIELDERGMPHINQEKCVGCGNCWNNCASEAISRTPIESEDKTNK